MKLQSMTVLASRAQAAYEQARLRCEGAATQIRLDVREKKAESEEKESLLCEELQLKDERLGRLQEELRESASKCEELRDSLQRKEKELSDLSAHGIRVSATARELPYDSAAICVNRRNLVKLLWLSKRINKGLNEHSFSFVY